MNGTLDDNAQAQFRRATEGNLKNIETVLQKANPKERARLIEQYRLQDFVDENGMIREGLAARLVHDGIDGKIWHDSDVQGLDFGGEVQYNKKQRQAYSQYNTSVMQWAFATTTKPGDTKLLYDPQNNTWNYLVADDTEERYGILNSIEDTPENAEIIKKLRSEIRHENHGTESGVGESVHENIDEYRAIRRSSRNDTISTQVGGADGQTRGVDRTQFASDRTRSYRESTTDQPNEVKLHDRRYVSPEAWNRGSEIQEELAAINADMRGSISGDASYDLKFKYVDKRKRSVYNRPKGKMRSSTSSYDTEAMQWAFATTTKPGDKKLLYNSDANTWDYLVADDTEERYGILKSIEDTPENAEKIQSWIAEVYNESDGTGSRTDNGIRADIENFRNIQRGGDADSSNAERRGAVRFRSDIDRTESSNNRESVDRSSAGTQSNEIKPSLKPADTDADAEYTDVEVFEGELPEAAQENYKQLKKAVVKLSSKTPTGMGFVLLKENPYFNGVVLKRGNIVYVTADTLTNGTWAAKLVHEVFHFAEGTVESRAMLKFLVEDAALTNKVVQRLTNKKSGYDFNRDTYNSLKRKIQRNNMDLTAEEERLAGELGAHMAEEVLGNERFIERIVREDASLAEKIMGKLRDLIDAFKSLTSREARAEYKRLQEAEKLYLAAVEKAGYNYVAGKIKKALDTALEEDEKEEREELPKNKYSYEALTSKDDVPIVDIPEVVPKANNEKTDRKSIVAEGRSNAREQNNSKNTQTETYVYVKDIDIDVLVRRDGLEHGLSRNDESTALATMKIGDLLKNSVAVNELNERKSGKRSTDMSYVLLAVGQNKNGSYLVRIVVDKTTNSVAEISTYGLYAIKAKKEGALFMPKGNEAVSEDRSYPYLRSTISIAELFENVKNLSLANEVFSKDVLNRLGVGRSEGTLSDDVRYSLKTHEPTEAERKRNYTLTTDGTEIKADANENHKKVYTKEDASKIVNTVLASTMYFGDTYGTLVGKSRAEVVEALWKGLNAAAPGKQMGVALDIADYIIRSAVVESAIENPDNAEARDRIDLLKTYIQRLDLSSIKDEIRYRYDKKAQSVFSRWGKRKGKPAVTPDVAALELAELGFAIDVDHPADILFAMDDAYRSALESIKKHTPPLEAGMNRAERADLQQEIARKILQGFVDHGSLSKLSKVVNEYAERLDKMRNERKEEKGRNTLVNRALDRLQKLKDLKLGTYHNVAAFNDARFKGSVERLAAIKYRGNLREAKTRELFADCLTVPCKSCFFHAPRLTSRGFDCIIKVRNVSLRTEEMK
ncbi:MAG: hypothetical protein IJW29_01140 [Clostridia bacterium]|nr:hypothetical protein [Clostridia bacterium]